MVITLTLDHIIYIPNLVPSLCFSCITITFESHNKASDSLKNKNLASFEKSRLFNSTLFSRYFHNPQRLF